MAEKKGGSKLNVAIIHHDLGIGGTERLIVDAAVELASHGHKVHVFTSHDAKNRCFEETVSDQVSIVIPLLKLKKATKVLFYCHLPDLLLAQHTTVLRRVYRKPIDFIEEMTTEMADKILANSKFTASMFTKTFKHLDARGIKPAVLYPAVNVNQFNEPANSYKLNFLSINRFERKKNIDLAISAFTLLHTLEGDMLQGPDLAEASLTIAGKFPLIISHEYSTNLNDSTREMHVPSLPYVAVEDCLSISEAMNNQVEACSNHPGCVIKLSLSSFAC